MPKIMVVPSQTDTLSFVILMLLTVVLFGVFAWIGLSYFRYRVHDLFILTACVLGGITIVTTVAARFSGGGIEFFFVLAALVVGLTAGAALWLKRVAQEWEEAA